MSASDEEVRARELAHTEMVRRRLEPLVDRAEPDLRAVELLLRTLDRRARLLSLGPKRPDRAASTVNVPNLTAEQRAARVERYMELSRKLLPQLVEAGYGSGEAPSRDDGSDEAWMAIDPARVVDRDLELDDGESENDDEVFVGKWVDGKFIPASPIVEEEWRPPFDLYPG
jgi:hypothetical protein